MIAGWMLMGCTMAEHELTVLSASSLTEAFTALEAKFEAQHPEVSVSIAFGGSQLMAAQLRAGAQADVFASANEGIVTDLHGEGVLEQGETFAVGALVVAVSADSPVDAFSALDTAQRVVIGVPGSPIGQYTEQLLMAAGDAYGASWRDAVLRRVVSRESNTRLVLTKVRMGEADAAVVYATDIQPSDRLRVLPIPPQLAPPVHFVEAAVAHGNTALATQWLSMVHGPDGQAILRGAGFGLVEP